MAKGASFSNDPISQMESKLKQASAQVKKQSQIWSANNLFGMVRIKFDAKNATLAAKAIEEGVDYGLSVAQDALREALDLAVSSSVWGWNEGGSRDIVDTGALRDSLTVSRQGKELLIDYSAPYASFVHYGGYIQPYGNASIAAVYIPGRPWVDSVLYGGGPVAQLDLDRIILDSIAAKI